MGYHGLEGQRPRLHSESDIHRIFRGTLDLIKLVLGLTDVLLSIQVANSRRVPPSVSLKYETLSIVAPLSNCTVLEIPQRNMLA